MLGLISMFLQTRWLRQFHVGSRRWKARVLRRGGVREQTTRPHCSTSRSNDLLFVGEQGALEAMGFCDVDLNRSLLDKHQGSIEAVVVELSSSAG